MLDLISDSGNKKVFVQLDQLENRTRRGIRQFWFVFGKTLVKSLNESVLAKPRAGRVYLTRIKGGSRRRHVASRAGESPANRTGTYRKSTGYQMRGAMEMMFGAEAPYAGFLENGTPKMKPRPGLGNAVRATEGESLMQAANEVNRALVR